MNVPDKITVDQIKTPETYYSKNNDFYGSVYYGADSPTPVAKLVQHQVKKQ